MSSEIKHVGVLGMGLMGSGIAQIAATRGFYIVVVDVNKEVLQSGLARIRENLERLVERHKVSDGQSGIPENEQERILSFLRTSTRRDDLVDCDLLIEAIAENEGNKRELITSLSDCGYQNLLVSNTSSISITRLASVYAYPDQFMGMHFMNPVPIQRGCELIRGFLTSNETAERVAAFCRALGKEPIFAEDKAGFGVNRMFVPFLVEGVKVVEEGIMTCEDADKMTLCLGHKMGPITTMDFIGLDTVLSIAEVLQRDLGNGYAAPDLLRKLVAAGFLGMKTGKGFYVWDQGRKASVNPVVARYRRRDL